MSQTSPLMWSTLISLMIIVTLQLYSLMPSCPTPTVSSRCYKKKSKKLLW